MDKINELQQVKEMLEAHRKVMFYELDKIQNAMHILDVFILNETTKKGK